VAIGVVRHRPPRAPRPPKHHAGSWSTTPAPERLLSNHLGAEASRVADPVRSSAPDRLLTNLYD
jgi:hypothetical protein